MTKQITQLILVIGLALLALLVALVWLAGPVAAANQCVIPGGGGGCFASIQAAINAVGSGETVRVVTGVYNERLTITKNLTLLGGCTTSACTTRNPGTSTINGGGSGVVIRITSGAAAIIDGFTITGGNGTTNNGQGGGISIRQATAIIRNNTIRGNVASTNPGIGGSGGGIHVISSTNPVGIYNNTIQANVAYSITLGSQYGVGGGIDIDHASSAIITGNQVLSNVAAQTNDPSSSAAGYGGGIAVDGNSVTLANNTIQGNLGIASGREGFGGGINIYRTPLVTLTNNIIVQNTAIISGSNAGGGGLTIGFTPSSSGSRLTLTGNWVMSNTAGVTVTGSDVFIGPGGVNISGSGGVNDTMTMQNNHLVGNVAVHQLIASANGSANGGGLSVDNFTSANIINNEIMNNVGAYTIPLNGGAVGGVHLFESTALLQGNVISGNTARQDAPGDGDGIFVNDGTVTMTRNRILGNRSGGILALICDLTSTNDVIAHNTGGGLVAGSFGPPTQVKIINDTFYDNGNVGIDTRNNPGITVGVTNTIVYSHEEGLRLEDRASTLSSNYNLLSNGVNYIGSVTGGANDILNQNPLFVNASNDNFHLANGSPAIDKGTSIGAPGVDFEGESRPQGPGVDIGADEKAQPRIYLPVIQKNS